MPKRKNKSGTIKRLSTQVVPVIGMSLAVEAELFEMMQRLGVVRSESYNKLGSVNHWGIDWRKAYSFVRSFRTPESLGLPSKLMEWTVSDVAKAISAQQAACIEALGKILHKRFPGQENKKRRNECYKQLSSPSFVDNPFLHRIVRKQFQRGHSSTRNQIVYQQGGYSCKRISRHTYQLELAGLHRGKRNRILVRSNRKITGQIRVIYNLQLQRFEIHFLVNYGVVNVSSERRSLGVDKGYTEAFYDSDGRTHGRGLGKLASRKSVRVAWPFGHRIAKKNRNRGKLWALHRKLKKIDPAKSARILHNNLSRKTENRRYRKDQAGILAIIGTASKSLFKGESLKVFAEDLTQPMKSKRQSKAMSRKLNSWMKGAMRDSLQKWANWTGSVVSEIQPSYTSQIDSFSGTLLGVRKGDRFTRFNGVVLQADHNAARNILARGTDKDISRFMTRVEVQAILLRRTARFLKGMDLSLVDAVKLGWLDSKHSRNQAFKELLIGMSGTSR
ncbi:zinc ribbon domain-containing protein [Moorena producens JHB]|uniref:Zinc ribbon domain-containing protein n=1 Tax=Moorena producens (strain JHB) TaxID=1454205 RepID=A0A1D9G2J9_MOOP1|nr:zinc ribbon domain-containing protein [Moorena producens]AOY81838.1 zinc ribbon domain-containing protein [Moorena producens JHB]